MRRRGGSASWGFRKNLAGRRTCPLGACREVLQETAGVCVASSRPGRDSRAGPGMKMGSCVLVPGWMLPTKSTSSRLAGTGQGRGLSSHGWVQPVGAGPSLPMAITWKSRAPRRACLLVIRGHPELYARCSIPEISSSRRLISACWCCRFV